MLSDEQIDQLSGRELDEAVAKALGETGSIEAMSSQDGGKSLNASTLDSRCWPSVESLRRWLTGEQNCGYLKEYQIMIDNYVGETRARAWAEIDKRDKQPTLTHLIDGLRLEWERTSSHSFAATALGLTWVVSFGEMAASWKGPDQHWKPCDSIDDGKARCLADYRQRVRAIFEGV